MKNNKEHWDNIYSKKEDNEVSWFQKEPKTSLTLIEKYSSGNKKISIVDIGGGNSLLVSGLVKKSFSDICVLDISKKALDRSRKRIKGAFVRWIEGNILDYDKLSHLDIWHDRAVFHFLTEKNDIQKYVSIASESVVKNGYLILGTFSESGPEKCSGLTITQYSESKFKQLFEKNFELVECFEEVHSTPFDTKQNFIWGMFKRK